MSACHDSDGEGHKGKMSVMFSLVQVFSNDGIKVIRNCSLQFVSHGSSNLKRSRRTIPLCPLVALGFLPAQSFCCSSDGTVFPSKATRQFPVKSKKPGPSRLLPCPRSYRPLFPSLFPLLLALGYSVTKLLTSSPSPRYSPSSPSPSSPSHPQLSPFPLPNLASPLSSKRRHGNRARGLADCHCD